MRHNYHAAARNLGAVFAAFFAGTIGATAAETISLPDAGLFPEGIAVDAKGGMYVGSLTEGRILYLDPKAHRARRFIPSGASGLVSVLGVLIGRDGGTLYACSSDPGMSQLKGSAKPAVVAFDASSGAPRGRFEVPAGGFCNDLTERPDGTILATDSFSAKIYALRPGENALEIWLSDPRFTGGEGFGLNGIASTQDAVYVVKYNSGQLFKIPVGRDGHPGSVREIKLKRGLKGPDGLEAVGKNQLIVIEGGGLSAGSRGNLTKITVTGDRGAIHVIASDLNVPTAAVIRNGIAYVVEGQLDHLMDPKAGPPDPFRIVKIKVN